jgi:hypothetical protein
VLGRRPKFGASEREFPTWRRGSCGKSAPQLPPRWAPVNYINGTRRSASVLQQQELAPPSRKNTIARTSLPRMAEITPARDTPVRDSDLDEKFDNPSQLEHGYDGSADKHLTDREGAIAAESAEQQMTFKEAIRDYPAAVFWSFAISLCIIMEGYDTALPVSGAGNAPKIPTDRTGQLCRHPSLPREVWRVCQRGSWLSTHSGLAIWPRTMLRCRIHPVSWQ